MRQQALDLFLWTFFLLRCSSSESVFWSSLQPCRGIDKTGQNVFSFFPCNSSSITTCSSIWPSITYLVSLISVPWSCLKFLPFREPASDQFFLQNGCGMFPHVTQSLCDFIPCWTVQPHSCPVGFWFPRKKPSSWGLFPPPYCSFCLEFITVHIWPSCQLLLFHSAFVLVGFLPQSLLYIFTESPSVWAQGSSIIQIFSLECTMLLIITFLQDFLSLICKLEDGDKSLHISGIPDVLCSEWPLLETKSIFAEWIIFSIHSLAPLLFNETMNFCDLVCLHMPLLLLLNVQLFATPWTAAHQASLSFTISWSLFKFMNIELVMLFNHLILCCSLLRLP